MSVLVRLYTDFQGNEAKKNLSDLPSFRKRCCMTVFKGLASVGISASVIKTWKKAWAPPVATGEPVSVDQISKI
jgi:hypothetical protein